MARYEPELIITQSLLDRLTDEEPGTSQDAPVTRAQSFRVFKAGLRRDLEWLLNTRQTPLPAPDRLAEVARSLYNFGLPDLMALSAQSTQVRNLQGTPSTCREYSMECRGISRPVDNLPCSGSRWN